MVLAMNFDKCRFVSSKVSEDDNNVVMELLVEEPYQMEDYYKDDIFNKVFDD